MRVDKCPHHGKGCSLSRTFNAKLFGEPSGLGEQEPFAYLGCWLSLGDRGRFPDAASHKNSGSGWDYNKGPGVEEVRAYARTMGWLPAEEDPAGP